MLINQALSDLRDNTIRITRWMEGNYQSGLKDFFMAALEASRDASLLLNSGIPFADRMIETQHWACWW